MRKKLIAIAGAMLLAIAATVSLAAPANAAAPTTVQATKAAFSVPAITPLMVHPNYPAGKYFFVCYSTAGTSVTLKDGQAVYSGCRGAASVSQYLESGQLVQHQSLSPGGSAAHAKFTGTADCYVAIGVAAFAVLTFEDSWVWYAGTAPTAYGLHACISG